MISSALGIPVCDFAVICASPENVLSEYMKWRLEIQREWGDFGLIVQTMDRDFASIVKSLYPLTSMIATKVALVATSNPNTCAYFDNGWQGSNSEPVASVLAKRLKVRALRVASVPDTMGLRSIDVAMKRYGAELVTVFSPDGALERSVSVVNDGGRWDFDSFGVPYPFEDQSTYSNKLARSRFDRSKLERVLDGLGLPALSLAWYQGASAPSYLIERTKGRSKEMTYYPFGDPRVAVYQPKK
jgi:hypothetical protein